MKTVHGWAFPDVDDFMAKEIHEDGSYQGGHLRAALQYVTDWSLAIDGGAHVGTWSKPLSERFARVLAIEPSADTFEALQANLQAFGCANVEAKNIALGAAPGTVTMILDGLQAERHNTGARYVQAGTGTIPTEPIDAWELPSLGFLKLDVEGSEYFALKGAMQTLKRCKPIVLFEDKFLWRRYGLDRLAPQTLLQSLGYRELERAKMDAIWGPR